MMPFAHYLAIAGLMAACITLPAVIIGYILHAVRQDLSEVRTTTARSMELLEGRLRELDENKVDRRDWLRSEASAANRIDRVCTKIDELSGKLEGGLLIASNVERLAESLGTKLQQAQA